MTLCPVALAIGCVKCPVFKACPAKGIIGDYKEPAAETPLRDDPEIQARTGERS